MVREAGLEPARPEWTLEPESSESANSTTRASLERLIIIASTCPIVKRFFAHSPEIFFTDFPANGILRLYSEKGRGPLCLWIVRP